VLAIDFADDMAHLHSLESHKVDMALRTLNAVNVHRGDKSPFLATNRGGQVKSDGRNLLYCRILKRGLRYQSNSQYRANRPYPGLVRFANRACQTRHPTPTKPHATVIPPSPCIPVFIRLACSSLDLGMYSTWPIMVTSINSSPGRSTQTSATTPNWSSG
jgi:hypothetical protein